MRSDKLAKRFPLYVAVLHHQIVPRREIFVEVLQHPPTLWWASSTTSHGRGAVRRSPASNRCCGSEQSPSENATRGCSTSALDPVDRVDAAFDAAERQMVGEPQRTGSETRPDFEYGARAHFGDQHRIHGKVEDVLHQRYAAPAHERRCALAGEQHVGAELGAEPRMIKNARALALQIVDETALTLAVEELPQPLQIPLQALALRRGDPWR